MLHDKGQYNADNDRNDQNVALIILHNGGHHITREPSHVDDEQNKKAQGSCYGGIEECSDGKSDNIRCDCFSFPDLFNCTLNYHDLFRKFFVLYSCILV